MGHVFISYSRNNQEYARKLAKDLRAKGIEPWNDEDIKHGARWWRAIDEAIRGCVAFVVVMTPESEDSEWVEREILLAQREVKPVFPLLLRGEVHSLLITTQHADVTDGQMPPKAFYDRLQLALPIAEQVTEQAEKKQSATTTSTYPVEKPIPKDVTYTIIDKHVVPNIKRSLDIRLNRKVTEAVLHSIAMKLKKSDPKSYERTFIVYYLPDMKVNAGGWAITHFTPDLEVRILGLTVEQEQAFKTEADDPSRDVIGTWLDESVLGRKITIFRKAGELFMDTKYKDGSGGTTELVEKASPRGSRFDYKTDRGNGEYYLINTEGNLQVWDQDGPFLTARKFD